jgi:hypothetical protein
LWGIILNMLAVFVIGIPMATDTEFFFTQKLIANRITKGYKTSLNQNLIYTELYTGDIDCFNSYGKFPLYITDRQVTESMFWRDPKKW